MGNECSDRWSSAHPPHTHALSSRPGPRYATRPMPFVGLVGPVQTNFRMRSKTRTACCDHECKAEEERRSTWAVQSVDGQMRPHEDPTPGRWMSFPSFRHLTCELTSAPFPYWSGALSTLPCAGMLANRPFVCVCVSARVRGCASFSVRPCQAPN